MLNAPVMQTMLHNPDMLRSLAMHSCIAWRRASSLLQISMNRQMRGLMDENPELERMIFVVVFFQTF